jgi:hypothetical protein
MFGDGGLGSLESRQDLAYAPFAIGKKLQQLQSDGIGKGAEDLHAQVRDGFMSHEIFELEP